MRLCPPPLGGWQPNRKWSRMPCLAPLPDCWVVPAVRGRVTCMWLGPGDKEESCRHDAAPDWARGQGPPHRMDGADRWGPAGTMGMYAGAPYQGAASPPPPPLAHVCVCVARQRVTGPELHGAERHTLYHRHI